MSIELKLYQYKENLELLDRIKALAIKALDKSQEEKDLIEQEIRSLAKLLK